MKTKLKFWQVLLFAVLISLSLVVLDYMITGEWNKTWLYSGMLAVLFIR